MHRLPDQMLVRPEIRVKVRRAGEPLHAKTSSGRYRPAAPRRAQLRSEALCKAGLRPSSRPGCRGDLCLAVLETQVTFCQRQPDRVGEVLYVRRLHHGDVVARNVHNLNHCIAGAFCALVRQLRKAKWMRPSIRGMILANYEDLAEVRSFEPVFP
jgi:hypothetical protein